MTLLFIAIYAGVSLLQAGRIRKSCPMPWQRLYIFGEHQGETFAILHVIKVTGSAVELNC